MKTARIAIVFALCGGAALLASAGHVAEPAAPADPVAANHLVPAFADEFDGNALDLRKWDEGKPGGTLSDMTLAGNAERQVYLMPSHFDLGVQPITAGHGHLTIEARELTPPERAVIAGAAAGMPPSAQTPAFKQLAYSSGRISNRQSFHLLYGYVEMRARVDAGRGLWPAFWMLANEGGWPPELDIMETLGHEPLKVYSSTHTAGGGTQHVVTTMTPTSDGYHRYGMLWTPRTVEYFIDGVPAGSVPTPPDAHKPMYILVNLAVGGYWPGYPDASTHFPAHMDVDYVRAWRFPKQPR